MPRLTLSERLMKWSRSKNIAEDLRKRDGGDILLSDIGQKVYQGYDIDWQSSDEWRKQNEKAVKLAKQVVEEKSFPWPGAANVKYPLITTAAIQFAARAYPEIVGAQGQDLVKARVLGKDITGEKSLRADRVAKFMSWQLLEEIGDWEEDMDKLLHMLPIIGCLFRKSYYNPMERRNDSVLLLPDEFVVHHKTKNLRACRRMTHEYKLYQNDIYERQASGLWLEEDLGMPTDSESMGDTEIPHTFLEQHRFWDLDDDGYEEPYIVTVHKDTKKVLRIMARFDESCVYMVERNGKPKVARIKPHLYFSKYSFIPNPDGGFYDIGFGTLLYHINESINTSLNEMLDAGAAHNAGGGFIGRGVNIKGGSLSFRLNEWKRIETAGMDLRNNIVPLPTREPSQVLYLLLGTLIEAGKDIASVKNVLMGEKPGENVSNELYESLVDQGLKVFIGIYKRIYRALTSEFKLHFWLNSRYLGDTPYNRMLDAPEKYVAREDFNEEDLDIRPVADPTMSLDVQRIARAKLLLEGLSMGLPGLVGVGVTKRWLDAMKTPNQEEIFNPQQAQQPDPKAVEAMAKLDMAKYKLESERQEIHANIQYRIAQMQELRTQSILNLAKAEAQQDGTQIEAYKAEVQRIEAIIKGQEVEVKRLQAKNPRQEQASE